MMVKDQKNFISGLLFMAFALCFFYGSTQMDLGDSAKPGTGFFPMLVSVGLGAVGLIVTILSLSGPYQPNEKFGHFAWRPVLCVLGSVLAFAFCLGGFTWGGKQILPPLGLIVGVFLLVFIASRADKKQFKYHSVFILSCVLSVLSYFLFIKGLGLNIPAWPQF